MTDEIEIPEGFTRWDGREEVPPGVLNGVTVDVVYSDGVKISKDNWERPWLWGWSDDGLDHLNIIAYRIVSP